MTQSETDNPDPLRVTDGARPSHAAAILHTCHASTRVGHAVFRGFLCPDGFGFDRKHGDQKQTKKLKKALHLSIPFCVGWGWLFSTYETHSQ